MAFTAQNQFIKNIFMDLQTLAKFICDHVKFDVKVENLVMSPSISSIHSLRNTPKPEC